jgi:hypothetical protein
MLDRPTAIVEFFEAKNERQSIVGMPLNVDDSCVSERIETLDRLIQESDDVPVAPVGVLLESAFFSKHLLENQEITLLQSGRCQWSFQASACRSLGKDSSSRRPTCKKDFVARDPELDDLVHRLEDHGPGDSLWLLRFSWRSKDHRRFRYRWCKDVAAIGVPSQTPATVRALEPSSRA